MGQWQTALLISSYAPVLQLGMINGLGREIPYNLGKGKKVKVQEYVSITCRIILLLLGILLSSIFFINFQDRLDISILVTIILFLSAARILNIFSTILLRSYQQFNLLGAHQILSSIILAFCILLVYWQPSLIIVAASMTIALSLSTLFSLKYWRIDPAILSMIPKLIKIGLPIYLAGITFALLGSVDRWLILFYLDIESLGLYTPAILVLGLIIIVPSLVSNIMYPKLAYSYGLNHSIEKLKPTIHRMILLNTSLTGVISFIGFLIMNFFLVPLYLPAYLPGLMAMNIIFLTGLILPIGLSFGDLFNVIGLQKKYLLNMIYALLINILIGSFFVVVLNFKIEGIALGTLAGLLLFTFSQFMTYRNLIVNRI